MNLVFLPTFCRLPNAFSSMVVKPPAMFPSVGCDSFFEGKSYDGLASIRNTVQDSIGPAMSECQH
jgi:hypothetical protein